jgi:hypothetical protein
MKRNLFCRIKLRVLVGKPEGNRALGRFRSRWDDNIETDFRVWNEGYGLDSSGSGQGTVANSCEHTNEYSGSIKL